MQKEKEMKVGDEWNEDNRWNGDLSLAASVMGNVLILAVFVALPLSINLIIGKAVVPEWVIGLIVIYGFARAILAFLFYATGPSVYFKFPNKTISLMFWELEFVAMWVDKHHVLDSVSWISVLSSMPVSASHVSVALAIASAVTGKAAIYSAAAGNGHCEGGRREHIC